LMSVNTYDALVIGVSAGGLAALTKILPGFDGKMHLPVLIVQHISPVSDDFLPQHFNKQCSQTVKEAEDKEPVLPDTIYFAPPNYHLLVEPDQSLALSAEERVNYSRPAIDVLFESAADVYSDKLIGLLLTGANTDGTHGMIKINKFGGLTIVQDPETAEVETMPLSAIEHSRIDYIVPLHEIAGFINNLVLQETP